MPPEREIWHNRVNILRKKMLDFYDVKLLTEFNKNYFKWDLWVIFTALLAQIGALPRVFQGSLSFGEYYRLYGSQA